MKLTGLLLLTAFLQVSAKTSSQDLVSFSGNKVPLQKVFTAIKDQTGYVFLWKAGLLDNAPPVTLELKNVPLEQAVREVLKGQPLTYTIKDKTIVISRLASTSGVITFDQPLLLPIKGTIKGTDEQPLAGASITIKGTNETVVSDEKGNFTINASVGQILVVSYVGYDAREVTITNAKNLTIGLELSLASLLNTVMINTGYQKISKERFVGSYAQLDSTNFHRRAGMGIIERLDGTVPGVLFDKKLGPFPIQIRGISTIASDVKSDPLIVVDNFPIIDGRSFQIENINPNDVESVTVLKDAAAASIWGSRAGNGVIVITTKRGKYNQRFQLSLSSNVTIEEKPDLFYYPVINPSDAIDIELFLFGKGLYNGNINNTFSRPVISPVVEILDRRRAGLITTADSAAQIDALRQYDIRNELNNHVYREAIRQQHYLGFSGGNNMLAYQFSFGYNHSLNNIQGSKPDNQYTVSANTSFRLIKNLDIQTGINFAQGIVKSYAPSLSGFSPYTRLVDDNGNALAVPYLLRQGYIDTVGGGKLLDWHYRPLDEIRFADINTNNKAISLNVNIGYKFTSWLQANVSYQYNNTLSTMRNHKSLQVFETRDLINRFTNFNQSSDNLRYPVPKGGILDLSNSQNKSYTARAMLNFNKSLGTNHVLTALAGAEINDSKGGYSNSQRLYGYDNLIGTYRFNVDYFDFYTRFYPSTSSAIIPANVNYGQQAVSRFVSILANVGYTYKNRYNFYASARRDGSNVFGVNTNNKWKPLWSAGAGWEISKESFYRVSWLPSLKLRASYGYTGNVTSTLSGFVTFRSSTSPDPFTNLPYNTPNVAPNADLRWEEVRITNAGLDFQLLQNRLSGSLEVFGKRATDIITFLPLASTSGTGSLNVNYGSLKTKGFELALNSTNIKGTIEWTSNFAFSHAKTIITKLYLTRFTASDFIGYGLNATAGQIAFGLSSYRWAGLDPATGDPQGYLNGQVSKSYQSIFSDSIQHQVFNGSSMPLYSGFIRNNLRWKGFTLSANITGRFKYYFREPSLDPRYSVAINPADVSYFADYYRRWQKPGDELITDVPSMPFPESFTAGQRSDFYRYAEIHVKRADNIRLQDVRLSYQWNNTRSKRIPFQSVQFFFYPNNLNVILWRASDSHFDPDFSGGFNAGAIPAPKTWTGGITLNF